MSLSDVTIGIKTFLRDEKMMHAVEGIIASMPEAKIIIADDGEPNDAKSRFYWDVQHQGHLVFQLRFDEGFGFKSNLIADAVTTPYLLIGSDDFEFRPSEVRTGIERLALILDTHPEISIACGRVDNSPYEYRLEFDENDGSVREIPIGDFDFERYHGFAVIVTNSGIPSAWCRYVDLTKNYCLVRREVFQKVRWDNDVKIGGGEHASWFIDAKRAGFKTVFVDDVNINAQGGPDSMEYNRYRRRANTKERPCFKKRGIKKYILASGKIDYQEVS